MMFCLTGMLWWMIKYVFAYERMRNELVCKKKIDLGTTFDHEAGERETMSALQDFLPCPAVQGRIEKFLTVQGRTGPNRATCVTGQDDRTGQGKIKCPVTVSDSNRYRTSYSSTYSNISMLFIFFVRLLVWIVVSIHCCSIIIKRIVSIFVRSRTKISMISGKPISHWLKVKSFIFAYPMMMKHPFNLLVFGLTMGH